MKNIYIAITVFFVGILLADIEELNTIFIENDLAYLTNTTYILTVFFSLMFIVVKNIYTITQYTDEIIPLQLGILSIAMAIIGFFIFYRILLLGTFVLIAAAYWNYAIVETYYPRKRVPD